MTQPMTQPMRQPTVLYTGGAFGKFHRKFVKSEKPSFSNGMKGAFGRPKYLHFPQFSIIFQAEHFFA